MANAYRALLDADMATKKAALAAAPPGTTQIECTECGEETSALVDADGKMSLPEHWHWRAGLCNWGDGVTLGIRHDHCPDGSED